MTSITTTTTTTIKTNKMDAGGTTKVQALRQQFENYDNIEIKKNKSNSKPTSSVPSSILKKPSVVGNNNNNCEPPSSELRKSSLSSTSSTMNINHNNEIYMSKPLPSSYTSVKRRPIAIQDGEEEEVCDDHHLEEDVDAEVASLTSSSTGSSTCVNGLNGSSSEDPSQIKLVVAPNNSSSALTPTLSSSSSSSSAASYGKIKRSNAFRQSNKDLGLDVPIIIPNNRTGLERVKSVDSSNPPNTNSKTNNSGSREPPSSSSFRSSQSSSHLYESGSGGGMSSSKTHQVHPQVKKAVNVVTPYQVSDIYTLKNNTSNNNKPHHHETCSVVEPSYAVPMIKRTPNNNPNKAMGGGGTGNTPKLEKKPPLPLIPPEKPPRTFLYDILSDRSKQQGHGYLSSSTTTRTQVSTATVRQTNKFHSEVNPNNPPPLYSVPHNHHHNPHPPLVRSKTEGQLILKGQGGGTKNTSNNQSNGNYIYSMTSAVPRVPPGNNIYSSTSEVRNTSFLYNNNPKSNTNYGLPPQSHNSGQSYLPYSRSTTNLHKYNNGSSNFGLPPVNPHYHPQLRSTNSSIYMMDLMEPLRSPPHPAAMSSPRGGGLGERSKSEWSLHQVLSPPNGITSNAAPVSPVKNNSINNSNKQQHVRRNTVTVHPNSSYGGNGHPSLESTTSSSSGSNRKHNLSNGGIQQSIQNIVNQLFSSTPSSSKEGQGATATTVSSSADSGIQLGSESLSSCDTPTTDSDYENEGEAIGGGGGINNSRQVVEQRKGYVRRVSSIRVQEMGASINRLIQQSTNKSTTPSEPLFECLLVVGLNRDPYTGTYHAYIRDKFPPNAKLPSGVEQFCFPDSVEWPCHEGSSAQFYTLAITDQRGLRKFGCCYRILPEGANICIPITYCLISSHRAIGFYKEVLREITIRHGYSEYQKRFLLEELYKKPFPLNGGHVTVTEAIMEAADSIYHKGGGGGCYPNPTFSFSASPTKTVSVKRRADPRLDEGDLVTLLTTVDLSIVLKVFGSLLLERKVVLISRALSTLSFCVEALESMLYPFSWQHTFIPILPLDMTDVLDAPAPFLIGVLRSSQNPWDKTLDEGIVVDLDQNKIISCVGDEATILPKRIWKKLRDALQLVLALSDQKDSTKNVLISECFIRMFVETMGHHSHHIMSQKDGMKIFERESFVKSCDSKAIQNFLEWFSETSMFHEFIQLKLKNASNQQHGLFDQRVMEQFELQSQNHPHSSPSNGKMVTPLSNSKNSNKLLFMNRGNNNHKSFGSWIKDAFVK